MARQRRLLLSPRHGPALTGASSYNVPFFGGTIRDRFTRCSLDMVRCTEIVGGKV